MARELFRKTLVIDPVSWHGRMYMYWRRHAKFKTSGYHENLCHYCRVVLVWAPVAWFFHASFLGLRPWMLPPAGILAGIITFFSVKFPHFMKEFGIGFGMAITAIAFAVGVIAAISYGLDEGWFYIPKPVANGTRAVGRGIATGWEIIAPVFYLVGRGIRFMSMPVLRPIGFMFLVIGVGVGLAVRWFFKAHVLKIVYPWTLVLVALYVWGWQHFPGPSRIETFVLVALGTLLALVFTTGMSVEYTRERALVGQPVLPRARVVAGATGRGVAKAGRGALLVGVAVATPLAYAAVGVGKGISRAATVAMRPVRRRPRRPRPRPVVEEAPPLPPVERKPKNQGPSIFKVLWHYIVARKQAYMCPLIEVARKEEAKVGSGSVR